MNTYYCFCSSQNVHAKSAMHFLIVPILSASLPYRFLTQPLGKKFLSINSISFSYLPLLFIDYVSHSFVSVIKTYLPLTCFSMILFISFSTLIYFISWVKYLSIEQIPFLPIQGKSIFRIHNLINSSAFSICFINGLHQSSVYWLKNKGIPLLFLVDRPKTGTGLRVFSSVL